MKKIEFVIGCLLIAFAISGCHSNKVPFRNDKIICCCNYITDINANFWRMDSIGENGFRRLISHNILNECSLKRKGLKELSSFFSKPNREDSFIDKNNTKIIEYTYFIYTETNSETGKHSSNNEHLVLQFGNDSLLLNVFVKQGKGF